MSSQTYNWKRFWCPRKSSINLTDGGYLCDPDSEWGQIYNPDVVPYESMSKVRCLVLLGEPGISKSYTMEVDRNAIHTRIKITWGNKNGCKGHPFWNHHPGNGFIINTALR